MGDKQILPPAVLSLARSISAKETSHFDQHLDRPLTEGRNQLVENLKRMTIQSATRRKGSNVSTAAHRSGADRQCLQQKTKQPRLPLSFNQSSLQFVVVETDLHAAVQLAELRCSVARQCDRGRLRH